MDNKFVVKFWGTRGSISISNQESHKYGGNTTCLQVINQNIPEDTFLIIDAGTGIVPLADEINSYAVQKKKKVKVIILYTHYHHDHTQGLLLSKILFNKRFVSLYLYGPKDQGYGPKEMMESIMKKPLFPLDFEEVESHVYCKSFINPAKYVFVIHQEAGLKVVTIDELESIENNGKFISIGKGKYSLNEMMVIRMHKTAHPENTVSYRLEDRSTNKVFVFVTDHENTDGIPNSFISHCSSADLLIMDSQYDRNTYDAWTSGFGHGTPDYAKRVAIQTKAKKLGLTHHDPGSKDTKIDEIMSTAKSDQYELVECRDYLEIDL